MLLQWLTSVYTARWIVSTTNCSLRNQRNILKTSGFILISVKENNDVMAKLTVYLGSGRVLCSSSVVSCFYSVVCKHCCHLQIRFRILFHMGKPMG